MRIVRLPVPNYVRFVILAIGFASIGCSDNGKPHGDKLIDVQPAQIEFGDVLSDGATLWSKVTIRNHSHFTVKIDRIQTSCGCTAVDVTDFLLGSGESRDVAVSFRPGATIGKRLANLVISSPTLKDPLVVPVIAWVKERFWFEPAIVDTVDAEDKLLVDFDAVTRESMPFVFVDSLDDNGMRLLKSEPIRPDDAIGQRLRLHYQIDPSSMNTDIWTVILGPESSVYGKKTLQVRRPPRLIASAGWKPRLVSLEQVYPGKYCKIVVNGPASNVRGLQATLRCSDSIEALAEIAQPIDDTTVVIMIKIPSEAKCGAFNAKLELTKRDSGEILHEVAVAGSVRSEPEP